MKLVFCVVLLFSSQLAMAVSEIGTIVPIANIAGVRTHSVTHQTIAARNLIQITVLGLPSTAGCSSVYVYADKDPYLYASITAGLTSAKTKNVQLIYDTDIGVRGPWGDSGSCPITSFTALYQ